MAGTDSLNLCSMLGKMAPLKPTHRNAVVVADNIMLGQQVALPILTVVPLLSSRIRRRM